jgi:glycosyltransferase involved in cell wall biosynthesis
MTHVVPPQRPPPRHGTIERPRALVAGFEFEQTAFRGTSFYARTLLRVLSELGIETVLLTGAAGSADKMLERLSIVRQLVEPSATTKWQRRTGFVRDILWPAPCPQVELELSDDILDRVNYLRWVDACLNRPAVYDFIRIRSARCWPAYKLAAGHVNLVMTPAPIHIRAPRGVPLVTAFHDLSPLLRVDHPPTDDAREFLCRIRGMERHSDAVLCSSEASRRELVCHFPSLARRCAVIHPPVSLFAEELALAQDPAIERGVLGRYGVEANGYLLYVGVLERKKNVRRLVDAYIAVRNQLRMPLLLIGWAGYGCHELEPVLSREAKWLRHLGYVAQLDKVVLLRNARALVFPSLYEGFGLPPLEAMQVGCPVLASNIPAVTEACGDGAYFVDCRSVRQIADGLVQIAGDERLRAELSSRGLRRAEQLSLRNYRERLGAFLSPFIPVAQASDTLLAGRSPADGDIPDAVAGGRLATATASAIER